MAKRSPGLSKRLGQQVVVQNRPGADGYTIMMVNLQHSLNPLLYDNLPRGRLIDARAKGYRLS